MTTVTWRTRLTFLTGVTVVAVILMMAFAGSRAGAAPAPKPGDNGTVKIHKSTTPVTDPRNEPHVCVFYLDAFGFDPGQSVSWQIKSWPPTGDRSVVSSGALALDAQGAGFTNDMTLANGHYKLFWNFTGENGAAKHKVFWVACPGPTPTPTTPAPSPSGSCTASPSEDCSPTPTPSPSCTCMHSPTPTPPTPTPTKSHHQTPTPQPTPTQTVTPGPAGGGLPTTGWPLALIAVAGIALLGTGGAAMVAARRRRGLHSR